MRTLYLLLLVAAITTQVQGQDYFPLGDDDVWEYGYIIDPPFAPADTARGDFARVVERVMINDTSYTVIDFPVVPSDTLRVDSQNRVWGRVAGRDALLFDVTASEGATYLFDRDGTGAYPYVVTVRRPGTIEVPAGRFEGAIEFEFDVPGTFDGVFYVTLAPGVGVLSGDSLYDLGYLFTATVGGRFITPLEDGPDLEGAAFAYPNPTPSATTVALPPGRWDRAVVLDVLGRRVAVLEVGACAAGCEIAWDGPATAGRYVVRVEGETTLAVPITVAR